MVAVVSCLPHITAANQIGQQTVRCAARNVELVCNRGKAQEVHRAGRATPGCPGFVQRMPIHLAFVLLHQRVVTAFARRRRLATALRLLGASDCCVCLLICRILFENGIIFQA